MARLTGRLVCRGYEMDARQRVSPTSLARYMEHMRWEAIFDESFALGALFQSGAKMVVRAQDLSIGAVAVHATELTLEISIARVGNSSITFKERAARVSDGVEVARAFVTAVVLDAANKVSRVPDAIRHAAEVEPVDQAPSLDFEVPHDAFTRLISIRPSDLDTLLHVNQSRYVDFVDDTRTLFHAAHPGKAALAHPTRIIVDYRRETHVGHDLLARACALHDQANTLADDLCDATDGGLVARARISSHA